MARPRFLVSAPLALSALLLLPLAGPAPARAEPRAAAVANAPAELLRRDFPPGKPGGRLVLALAAEPRGFNPLVATDNPSLTLLYLMNADLWHIDRGSQATVAALAKTLTPSADGRKYRAELRRGIFFSDGRPLRADDVVFTYRALTDDAVGAVGAAGLEFPEGKLKVRKVDDYTVDFELPAPSASGERLFDSQAILPEHLLGGAYRDGKLAEAWGLGSDPAKIAGLGPFRLKSHAPGEKLVLERNPFYWQEDAAGRRLPYLDEIVFLFVADEAARGLRFEAGETQVAGPLGGETFQRLERLATEPGASFSLYDLGPGLTYHTLFFNLNAPGPATGPALARKQEWFRRKLFRQAVSLAIDRPAMVRLVYRGKASATASHVSPGNRLFADPAAAAAPRDLEGARRLLLAAGFHYVSAGEGKAGELYDEKNQRVAFTLATNASNRERVQLATLLQADLAALGMEVTVAPLEFRSLIERVTASFDFEAAILGLGGGDPDPNSTLNVWQSAGRSHLWQMSGKPIFPFEEKLDALMARQMVERDGAKRRALLAEAQALIHDEEPLIALVTPHVLAAARRGLERFAPAIVDPPTLWNAEELWWRSAAP